MATLILSAAGTAIGGPLGGAVGALLGQGLDRAVLGTGRREGRRLADLAVQTSSYGTEIPRLFGTLRVAGTVIWSTDLIETRSTTGGKGRPQTTNYAYQVSFAVALSARPIRSVARIWADGRLIRGRAGDFKVRTGFRVHLGGEDQGVDPLIASAEGAAAPAHRGIAYAVFEGLDLAEFGNRIPSLTFEVVADDGAVASGAVIRTLAEEVAEAADGLMLDGFAASGGSVHSVLWMLAEASGGWFGSVDGRLRFRIGGLPREIVDAGHGAPRRVRSVAARDTVPGMVSVAHHDAARDYQSGLQRVRDPDGGRREERIAVPAALTPAAAGGVAEAVLARRRAERVRRTVAAGLEALDVAPGDVVAIRGEAGHWRVARATLEGMAVVLDLVPLPGAIATRVASGGRVLAQPDAVAGGTILHVFETPALDDAPLAAPRLTVAAAGGSAGWRRAALLVSTDAGGSWDEGGGTAPAAVIGTVVTPSAPGPATLADLSATLVVRLAHGAMGLHDADEAALDRGGNLALVGDELLQFGCAEALGEDRWRLSRLLRGRRGTEWAIGGQAAGSRFVLLEPGTLRTIALPAASREARVLASGVGDAEAVGAAVLLDGASTCPPTVARLGWEPADAGTARVHWVRRSRAGWRWNDGAEVPLAEEAERYLLTLTAADGTDTSMECAVPWAIVPRGTTVIVRQAGTLGLSRPATIAVPA